MQPVDARAFEPASLSGGESVEILRFFFKLKSTTPELDAAVDAAIAWFASHELPGSPGAWGRFYSILTQQAIFPGKKDGKPWKTEAEMRLRNPGGYDFHVNKPKDLPKWYQKWRKALVQD